jgi:hypothetical protein
MLRWVKIFFRRLFKRLINAFNLKEIWTWEYESCVDCGKCYRLFYHLQNEIWNKIAPDNICLCIDCLIKRANKSKIILKLEYFESIDILYIKE